MPDSLVQGVCIGDSNMLKLLSLTPQHNVDDIKVSNNVIDSKEMRKTRLALREFSIFAQIFKQITLL